LAGTKGNKQNRGPKRAATTKGKMLWIIPIEEKMKLIVAALALLTGITASAQSIDTIAKARKTTYKFSVDIYGTQTCSATAVAPHALLLAEHCDNITDKLYLKETKKDNPITVLDRISDDKDHLIYEVDYTFPEYSKIVLGNKFPQGENVFILGNPEEMYSQFRRGYVSGSMTEEGEYGKGDTYITFDMHAFFGDSGSAIFNEKGEVIGVATTIHDKARVVKSEDDIEVYNIEFLTTRPFEFTEDDLKEASNFKPDTDDKVDKPKKSILDVLFSK
jgi:hypothetical protein